MQKATSLLISTLVLAGTCLQTYAQQPQRGRCPGLRALDGSCAKEKTVEVADARSTILSTVRTSYYGTPFGSIGGQYIPFERHFRTDTTVDGLPTITNTVTFSVGPATNVIFLRSK